ncbi:MAG: hypothetical protein P8X83_03380 [Nitrosopumilaceae archaeon]|jgi:hypothetical protein
MSLLNCQEATRLHDSCLKISETPGVTFTGVINKNGRLVAGGFSTNNHPYEKGELYMIFLELYLDYSMRREFDSALGKISYMTTLRKHVNVTTIPFKEELILIFSDPSTNIEKIVKKTNKIFGDFFNYQVLH